MRIKPFIGLTALAAIGLAACGSSGTYTTPGAAAAAPVPTSVSRARRFLDHRAAGQPGSGFRHAG